ncbi:unnamed protein product [Lactuca virosa]|uniref:Uncharacterized protein n=1 Tax=Lactuca virosa TaxID=75947 RepID=A0AAU9N9M9_9ASTR|nr:unnamed protein product [Lactuca virosa]
MGRSSLKIVFMVALLLAISGMQMSYASNEREYVVTQKSTSKNNGDDMSDRKAQLGKDPEFCDLYVKTHGTSESKKRYFEGERENIEYCSEIAKDAKDAYLEGLVMKYGEDPTNHRHDAEVWVESQIRRTRGKKKGHIYGIGASDANFVVSGITSSESTRSTQSNNNTQEEIDRLREEVSNMRQLQEQMVQQMERMARMMNGTTNQANDPPHTPPHTPPEDGV